MNLIRDDRITIQTQTGSSELECPRCGSNYLHHHAVVSYDIRREDDDQCIVTTVGSGKVSTEVVPMKDAGNPSSRRDGLAIVFSCEGCTVDATTDVLELTIGQHKGCTELRWRYSPRQPQPKY